MLFGRFNSRHFSMFKSMENNSYSIKDLSADLFWDVDSSLLDFDTSKVVIIQKVLEYGLINDWVIIKKVYGKPTILQTALQLRNLDDVTLSFLSNVFNVNKQEFRCYTHKTLIKNC